MSTRTVIEELRQLFATHGLPNTIVQSDMLELPRFIRHQTDKQRGWSARQKRLCEKWYTEAGNSV
ncbi:hypothetical protein T08_13322 [Trichinella sp. T8]|nr:hypothetical protein T08_13322 [Trichinella sp. T8]